MAEKKLPLSTLRVLAIGDGPATVSIAREWANDLTNQGHAEQFIVDLAILRDDDIVELRKNWPLALRRMGLNDLSTHERARIARRLLTTAFLEQCISPSHFAGEYRAFVEECLMESDHRLLRQEYDLLLELDDVLSWIIPQSERDASAARALQSLRTEGLDPFNPYAWVLKRMEALGFVDASGAPLEPRW